MRWLRQHSEGARIVVVARVSAENGAHVLTLADYGRTSGAETLVGSYVSREAAIAAAEAVVRSRYGGHTCGQSCSGWAQEADTP